MGYNNVAEQWTTDPMKLESLFIDLAESTHPDQEIKLSSLVGQLPRIAHYAPKTQLEILRALIVKMKSKKWEGDRIVRAPGGVYHWQCRNWAAA